MKNHHFKIIFSLFITSANVPAASLSGLNGSTELKIPTITSVSFDETFYELGKAHGRDRFWEMDYFRRTAEGTLAEVEGKRVIETDFLFRLLDLKSHAVRLFAELSKTEQAHLIRYAEGVNESLRAAIAKKNLPYEYERWAGIPSEWHPADCIQVMLLQSFDQTRKNIEQRIGEQKALNHWGNSIVSVVQKLSNLLPNEEVPWQTAIVKDNELPENKKFTRRALPSLSRPRGKETGSNNWVIAPSRSETGHAWLANDPHLGLKHPPYWYWVDLKWPGHEFIGATLPGLPVLVSGTNGHAAWGVTNSYIDVMDLVAVPDSELKAAVTFRPWVWMKWGFLKFPIFFKTLQRTPDGKWPILPLDLKAGHKLILQWTGFELRGSDIENLFRLPMAKTVAEVDQAFAKIHVPSWNFVFADRNGEIGYRAIGRVPKRLASDLRSSMRGLPSRSLSELSTFSTEILSESEMPHLMNPKRGFITTANNVQFSNNTRLVMGRAHSPSFRAYRIEELIRAKQKQNLQSLQAMQTDVKVNDAPFFKSILLNALPEIQKKEASAIFSQWNNFADTDCRACALYAKWFDTLQYKLMLDEATLYTLMHPTLSEVRKALTDAEFSEYEIIREKIRDEIVKSYAATQAIFMEKWKTLTPRWGDVHHARFTHHLGQEAYFSKGIETPGDVHSVNPGSWTWDYIGGTGFDHTEGASQRVLIELSNPPRFYGVLAGPNDDVNTTERLEGGWKDWQQGKYRHYPENVFKSNK